MVLGNIQELNVDCNSPTEYKSITIKQHDVGSRMLKITLFDNGEIYTIPSGCTATIQGTNFQGGLIDELALVVDNQVVYLATEPFTSVAGISKCEVVLNNVTLGEVFRSTTFPITIDKSAVAEGAVTNNGAVSALDAIIAAYELALHDNTDIAIAELRQDVIYYGDGLDLENAIPIDAGLLDGQVPSFYATASDIAEVSKHSLSIINVKSLGAKGDGATDDTAYFTEAISLLSATGGIIYIPSSANYYCISTQLNIPSNIVIMGDGYTSQLHLTLDSVDGAFLLCSGVSNVEIKDISISQYTDATHTQDNNAIGITASSRIKVKNISVISSTWKGITCQSLCENILIENCDVTGCYKYGIGVEYITCKNISILNCTSHGNTGQGFYFDGISTYMSDIIIDNCISYSNVGYGLYMANCKDINININTYLNSNGNHIVSCTRIYLNGKSHDNLIYGNYIGTSSECVISNDSYLNGQSGIYLITSSKCNLINAKSNSNAQTDANHANLRIATDCTTIKIINSNISTGTRSLSATGDNFEFILSEVAATGGSFLPSTVSKVTGNTKELPISLSAGITAVNTPAYGVPKITYSNGKIKLSGCTTGTLVFGTQIGTVPTGYFPDKYELIDCIYFTTNTSDGIKGVVAVYNDGRVVCYSNPTSKTNVWFNGDY